jgi:hypothetical protein
LCEAETHVLVEWHRHLVAVSIDPVLESCLLLVRVNSEMVQPQRQMEPVRNDYLPVHD